MALTEILNVGSTIIIVAIFIFPMKLDLRKDSNLAQTQVLAGISRELSPDCAPDRMAFHDGLLIAVDAVEPSIACVSSSSNCAFNGWRFESVGDLEFFPKEKYPRLLRFFCTERKRPVFNMDNEIWRGWRWSGCRFFGELMNNEPTDYSYRNQAECPKNLTQDRTHKPNLPHHLRRSSPMARAFEIIKREGLN